MKTRSFMAVVCLFIALISRAQPAPLVQQTTSPPTNTDFSPINREGHDTTWQRTEWTQAQTGEWLPQVHTVIETATGLNYLDSSGAWQPSVEDIEPSPAGAAATQGQHKVTFAADIATTGAINLQMPDGQQLKTELLGLCYTDQASGKTIFIAIVTNSIGAIVGSNQVWYENAFCGLKGSVRYEYTKSSFEQNVVLEECPAPPEAYGLSSASTVLQAVTGIESAPAASLSTNKVSLPGATSQLADQNIRFPSMMIGHGRAFLIGDNDSTGVAVCKQWAVWSGQQVLVEQIPMPQIAAQLQTLPSTQTSASTYSNSVLKVVSARRSGTGVPRVTSAAAPLKKFASLHPKTAGFVLDYNTINTSQANCVFQGNVTYFLSANVTLSGTNSVFEGNTVLKFASGVTLTVDTPITWLGTAYRPVDMLSKDDTNTAESVSGATGNPGNNYYAKTALFYDGSFAGTNLSIDSLKVANAQTAVAINSSSGHVLSDIQLLNCGNGIAATNTDVTLQNALFWVVQTNFTGSSATNTVEQLTSDTAALLNQSTVINLFLTNCLLVSVTNISNFAGDHVAMPSNSSGIFQAAMPGGFHYLADGSQYRNWGTTNISAATLTLLAQKTTYPPIVYSNVAISLPMTFGPQAQRDDDIPDVGYHYDPLDWVFSQVDANSNLTFTAGTAVGWFRTTSGGHHAGHGIHIGNQQLVSFNGTATSPDYWVRCNTVQEQDKSGGSGPGGMTSWADQAGPYTNAATVSGQFLKSITMGWVDNAYRDDSGFLIGKFNNCEFYATGAGSFVSTYFFSNCLFYRAFAQAWQGSPGNEMRFQNCTFWGGLITLEPTNSLGITVQDCSLDAGVQVQTANRGANPSYATYDHNAYTNALDPFPLGGSGDTNVMTFNWQPGTFGGFYLPDDSPLINAGSTLAANVGLFQFTTVTDPNTDEGSSTVDIGYHHVAVDFNGDPVDTNQDGIPDYIEDANGNGLVDSGEIGWNIEPDIGLKVLITRPRNGSTLP